MNSSVKFSIVCKSYIVDVTSWGNDVTNMTNKIYPEIDPCGMSLMTGFHSEDAPNKFVMDESESFQSI